MNLDELYELDTGADTQTTGINEESIKEYIASGNVDETTLINLLATLTNDIAVKQLVDQYVSTVTTVAADQKSLARQIKEQVAKQQRLIYNNANHRMLSEFIPNHPLNIDLKIPAGYILDKSRGIVRLIPGGTPEDICPYIVLPYEILTDPADTSGAKLLRLIKWNDHGGKWVYHPQPVSVDKVTTAKEVGILNKYGVIVLKDDLRKPFTAFFSDLYNLNNELHGLKTNTVIRQCGWTDRDEFFPFTTNNSDEELVFISNPGTTIRSIVDIVNRELPRGDMNKAIGVVNSMKDNPVFATTLAGCLASPMIPRLKKIIDENIGIDVYGKSSSGKTTIQTLATNLVYGLGDEIKSSWSKATLSGIWTNAEAMNNLPIILDDTHRMEEKLYGVPHDLINGKEGNKSIKTTDNQWESKDTTKNRYSGVVMFNGEVSIASKTPNDSAGIFGRVIMIDHPPFPPEYDAFTVDELKRDAWLHGGHFIQPWIEHIRTFDNQTLNDQLTEVSKEFRNDSRNSLYGRLVMKVSLLYWCLIEFNKIFGTNINLDEVRKMLKRCMGARTENATVSDKLAEEIITSVYAKCVNLQPKGAGYYLDWSGDTQNLINSDLPGGQIDVYFVPGQKIILTKDVLFSIFRKHGRRSEEVNRANIDLLYNNDQIIRNRTVARFSRPAAGDYESNKPGIYGYYFDITKVQQIYNNVTAYID